MSAQFKECRSWNTKGGVESQDEGKQVSNTRWYCRNKLEVILEQSF